MKWVACWVWPSRRSYGPFAVLQFDNGVTFDFIEDTAEIKAQHYAFLVGEDDFDAIWDRLKEQGRQWWADPHKRQPREINHGDGGRGLYWQGPDGHWLEIITWPYGSGPEAGQRAQNKSLVASRLRW